MRMESGPWTRRSVALSVGLRLSGSANLTVNSHIFPAEEMEMEMRQETFLTFDTSSSGVDPSHSPLHPSSTRKRRHDDDVADDGGVKRWKPPLSRPLLPSLLQSSSSHHAYLHAYSYLRRDWLAFGLTGREPLVRREGGEIDGPHALEEGQPSHSPSQRCGTALELLTNSPT